MYSHDLCGVQTVCPVSHASLQTASLSHRRSSQRIWLGSSSGSLAFFSLRLSCFCTQLPSKYFVLALEPTFTSLCMESFHRHQTLDQCLFTHPQIALACSLLIPARLGCS